MSELITTEEFKSIKAFVKSIKLENYDYNDVDYNLVKEAMLSSPLVNKRLKLVPSHEFVHKNENGKCYIESEQEKIAFDEKYYPLVSLAADCNLSDVDSIGFLKTILSRLEQFFKNLKNFSNEEKQVRKSLLEYIKNIDIQYLNMRKDIMRIEDKFDNQLIELLFLLPDLTVYLIKFLADEEVLFETKMRIVTALVYIVVPLDLIPEQLLGPIGMIDDVYVALFIIVETLFNSEISEDTLRKYWPGKTDELRSLKEKYAVISEYLGVNLVGLIKKTFETRNSKTFSAI